MTIRCGSVGCSIALLAVIFGARDVVAQNSTQLRVHVVDRSGAPSARAIVTVYADGRTDIIRGSTDENGTCEFPLPAPGTYLIDVHAPPLDALRAARVTVEPGIVNEITLTPQLGGFETEIVVTASNAPERRDDVAKAFAVVQGSEIETHDVYALGDTIRAEPATRIEQLGGPGSQTSIRLNGLRGQDTGVLIDGVPIRDLSATQGDATSVISDLLITNAERVEVLRGAGADLYGSNTIGGAVNVILRSGAQTLSGDALFEGGGLGLIRSNAWFGAGAAGGRLTYGVGASAFHADRGVDGDDRAWNTTAAGRATARIGRSTLSAMFDGARAFTMLNNSPAAIASSPIGIISAVPVADSVLSAYERGTPADALAIGTATFLPAADDPDSQRRSHSAISLVDFSEQIADGIGYTAAYHRVATSRRFDNGPRGAGFQPGGATRSTFDGIDDAVDVSAHVRLGARHLVTAAWQLERERYTNASLPENLAAASTADVTEWTQSASVQDRLAIGALQLTAGARLELFSLETPRFSPAASAPYQSVAFQSPPNAYTADAAAAFVVAATGTKLRAHIGGGYREPSLFERFGTSFGSRGYSIYGDPRLAPERSLGLDAGIEQDLSRRLHVVVEAFTTRLDRVIVFDLSGSFGGADPFGRAIGYRNLAAGRMSGAAVSARFDTGSRLTIEPAYTFLTRTASDGPTDLSLAFGLPRHELSLRAVGRVSERLQIAASLVAAGSYLAPLSDAVTFAGAVYRFDGMKRLDLSGVYRLPVARARALRFIGRVDNVGNQTYYESGFRTPGRTASVGVGFDF